jgi:hypothetical protein
MEIEPNEGPGPSLSSFPSSSQVGTPSQALPRPQPATGKEKGWKLVLRRQRPCRLLLWTRDDPASTAGRTAESCNFLSWRPDYGPAQRLTVQTAKLLHLTRRGDSYNVLSSCSYGPASELVCRRFGISISPCQRNTRDDDNDSREAPDGHGQASCR